MKIYRNIEGVEEVVLDILVDDSSVRYRSIMGDNSLTLNFSTVEPASIAIGAYCDFEGQRYTLFYPENFKKHNTRNFEYTLVLHGNQESLKLYKFKDLSAKPYRLKFPLTATPYDFVKLLVDNLNQHDSGWSVGGYIEADDKLISFNHEFCYDVLNRIAQEFNTEWEIENKTIHLRKIEKYKDDPLPLSYGKGNGFKSGVGRSNEGDKQPIGRLYVQGGERNIDYSTYGSSTLLLPKSATLAQDGKTYRTDSDGMYITRDGNDNPAEDSFDAADIYPKRVGTVSHVVVVDAEKHFYDIRDTSIPQSLDYGNCRIAGEKATIVFQSGALAGREFDIQQTDSALTGYDHAERKFQIVPAELDGFVMPGGVFVPAVGDKYAIFNISMPQAYISDDATQGGASWDMFREAVRYFAENEEPRFSFRGELDGVWSRNKWLEIGGKIVPGGYVLFSDSQFQPDGIKVRITSIKDYVNVPHKPEITLSNAPVSMSFGSALGKLEAEEVVREEQKKELIRFNKRTWSNAKQTIAMLEDAIEGFDPSITPATVQTMAMLVGSDNTQFNFRNQQTVTFNPADKKLTASSGQLRLMMNIKDISPVHADADYGQINVAQYVSPPLTDPKKSYYLYISASKNWANVQFFLSEEAFKFDGGGAWYFLVGILNSEDETGNRDFVRLHGFTEILPGRINTEKIVSTDGKTYFDLINGIIAGRIRFINSAGDEQVLDEFSDGKDAPPLKIQYATSSSGTWYDTYAAGRVWMRTSSDGGVTWSAAMKVVGDPGANAPYLKVQYSTAASGQTWYDTYAAGRVWMRTSSDGGVTWSIPMKVVGDPGANAPYLRVQYSTAASGQTWYDTYAAGRVWMRTSSDGGVTWSIPMKVVGEKGEDGDYTDFEFAKSTSLTVAPADGWQDGPPALSADEYLWMRTRQVVGGSPGSWSYARISGPKGDDGISIVGMTEQWYLSTSDTAQAGGSWTETIPEWTAGKTIWQRFKITYSNGTAGFTEPQKYSAAEALQKVNIAKAITDKFGTTVTGGLVQTVTMLLREANKETVTAGISGIQGENGDNPAFWAGGLTRGGYDNAAALVEYLWHMSEGTPAGTGAGQYNYAEKYAELSNIAIMHDGAAKLGTLVVEKSGGVMILDRSTGKERLIMNSLPIPALGDLLSSANFGDEATNAARTSSVDVILPSAINVAKNGSSIRFTASAFSFSAIMPSQNHYAEASILLFRDGVLAYTVANLIGFGSNPQDSASNIDVTLPYAPAGTWSVGVRFSYTTPPSSKTFTLSSSKLEWKFVQAGIRRQQFGLDGLMAFYSSNHFHFTENGGLDVKGAVNMPGVLHAGTVSSTGGLTNQWGAKKITSGSDVTRPSVGTYRIYHTIGHVNYSVQVTPTTMSNAEIGTKQPTYFEVLMRGRGQHELQYAGFDFMVIGRNY